MRVLPTNSDPYCTGAEFLHAIDAAGGTPERVRTDCGTENVYIFFFLQENSQDEWYWASSGRLTESDSQQGN